MQIFDLVIFSRALEGMFRSLNSLLERFHQSFFFYLLSSTSRYVSIGLYMPPLGCLMIGPVLAAVSCWVRSVEDKGRMCLISTTPRQSQKLGVHESSWFRDNITSTLIQLILWFDWGVKIDDLPCKLPFNAGLIQA